MKQFITLIFAIALILFSGIWESKYLYNTSLYLKSDIEYSKNAVLNNDFNLAKGHIDEIDNTWSNMKTLWKIFSTHQEIEEIEEALASYKVSIKMESKSDVEYYFERLNKKLEMVVEDHKFLIENII